MLSQGSAWTGGERSPIALDEGRACIWLAIPVRWDHRGKEQATSELMKCGVTRIESTGKCAAADPRLS